MPRQIPIFDKFERQYIRNLQEWLRCVHTCPACKISKPLERFPRTINFQECFDCLDDLEEIPKEWATERNQWRARRTRESQRQFVAEFIDKKL